MIRDTELIRVFGFQHESLLFARSHRQRILPQIEIIEKYEQFHFQRKNLSVFE